LGNDPNDILAKPVIQQVVGYICPYFIDKFGFDPNCKIYSFASECSMKMYGSGAININKMSVSLGINDSFCLDLIKLPIDKFK